MAQSLEQKLAEIREISSPAALKPHLRDTNNVVSSAAVTQAVKLNAAELSADISALLLSLLKSKDPIKSDKGCRTKVACVKALAVFDDLYQNYDLLTVALRHRQLEPVFGGRDDTGAFLRGETVQVLGKINFKDAAMEIAALLFDECPFPQTAAIKTLKHINNDVAQTSLRLKALADNSTDEVAAELFTAIAQIDPDPIGFLTSFLYNGSSATGKTNALFALGGLKNVEAFNILKDFWGENTDLGLRKQIIMAISFTRTEEGYDFLKKLLREGGSVAEYSAQSIGIYLQNDKKYAEISTLLKNIGDKKLIDTVSDAIKP